MRGDETPGARAGGRLFALVFVVLALFLLSRLGAETKFSARGPLAAQPAFWPAIGVAGMAGFGLAHLIVSRRGRWGADLAEGAFWLRPLEYLGWFMVYVFAVPQVGYLVATLAFAVALALRAGYRTPGMLGAAAATGLAIVVIFKTLLAVKIPGGAVYEVLPQALRTFMIVNF